MTCVSESSCWPCDDVAVGGGQVAAPAAPPPHGAFRAEMSTANVVKSLAKTAMRIRSSCGQGGA